MLEQSGPFFGLPGEIRNLIYEYLLTNADDIPIMRASSHSQKMVPFKEEFSSEHRDPVGFNFLHTCRQAYNEGSHVFYTRNIFMVTLGTTMNDQNVWFPRWIEMSRILHLHLDINTEMDDYCYEGLDIGTYLGDLYRGLVGLNRLRTMDVLECIDIYFPNTCWDSWDNFESAVHQLLQEIPWDIKTERIRWGDRRKVIDLPLRGSSGRMSRDAGRKELKQIWNAHTWE